MKIHKKFVEQILFKRKAYFAELIIGKESLDLPSKKTEEIVDELDRIFYTLEFLERSNLITVEKYIDNKYLCLFNDFKFANKDKNTHCQFFTNKLVIEDKMLSWKIEMGSGLIAFKNNGFKTDEQIKDGRNLWLPILIAIMVAIMPTILNFILEDPSIPDCIVELKNS